MSARSDSGITKWDEILYEALEDLQKLNCGTITNEEFLSKWWSHSNQIRLHCEKKSERLIKIMELIREIAKL